METIFLFIRLAEERKTAKLKFNMSKVTVLMLSIAFAAADAGRALATGEETATIEHLTRLEHKFAEAALAQDFATIEALLAPDFVGVNPYGMELSRAQVLDRMRSPDRRVTSLRHEKIRVRLFGDTAVVLAVTVVSGEDTGELVRGEFPYMRVWVKRQGRWLAVATQSSAMPP